MKALAAASISVLLAGFGGNLAHQPLSDAHLKELWSAPKESAERIVSDMTLREKIGQMVMLDIRRFTPQNGGTPKSVEVLPEQLAKAINDYRIGSVIFFRENLVNTSQTYALSSDVQKARYNLPLLIGTDQEGGLVTRLRVGTEMPGNMAVGATRNVSLAELSGAVHGSELSALGMNFNFASDVDVNVNQNNPVIGVRSFGSDPSLVGEMAVAYMKGLEKNNVTATIKHFPGHGNVDTDSHVGLPVVPYSEAEWRVNDFAPFKYCMEHGVKAIMTAHIVVPALDDTMVISKKDGSKIGLPATLSKKILTGILRQEVRYNGLIMTDAMEMAAIAENFGANEAVVRAFLAGVDIVMMPVGVRDPRGIAQLGELFAHVEREASTNPELARRIEESVLRLVQYKLDNKIVPHPIFDEQHAHNVVGSSLHKAHERRVAEKAITLIENQGILPFALTAARTNKILVISDEPARNIIISNELGRIAAETQVQIDATGVECYLAGNAIPSGLEQQIGSSDFVIMVTYNLRRKGTAAQTVIDISNAVNKPLVVISGLNPYDASALSKVKANIAIYGITGFDITNALRNLLEANIKAGIRTLFKDTRGVPLNMPLGKLPVDIKDPTGTIIYPFGHGLHYN